MTVCVLVAVLRKRLELSADLYTIFQVLSLTLFEKMPIFKLFSDTDYNSSNSEWLCFFTVQQCHVVRTGFAATCSTRTSPHVA